MKLHFSLPLSALMLSLGACSSVDSSSSDASSSGASETGSQVSAVTCPESPAGTLFDSALCLCGDLQGVGRGLTVRGVGNSTANVGINGTASVVGNYEVGGSLIAYQGIRGTGNLNVRDNVLSAGDVNSLGHLVSGGDFSVGGNLAGVGRMEVGGVLRVAGDTLRLGADAIASVGDYQAPTAPPCRCDPSTFFNVGAAVTAAKEDNDNDLLPGGPEAARTLNTGKYYFPALSNVGRYALRVEGAVSIYVDGDVASVGNSEFDLAPGATLDLYVAGSVRTVGHSKLGDAEGGTLRLYVGGSDPVIVSVGNAQLHGSIYAPQAQIQFTGSLKVDGAVFAHSLQGAGNVEISYASQTSPSSEVCVPPEEETPAAPGTGTPGTGTPGTETPPETRCRPVEAFCGNGQGACCSGLMCNDQGVCAPAIG